MGDDTNPLKKGEAAFDECDRYDGMCDQEMDREPETCPECLGEGFVVVCCDDVCVAMGECIHGDGDAICPVCQGEGEV